MIEHPEGRRFLIRLSPELAGEPGFEPGLHGPEPCVLPLDDSPASTKRCARCGEVKPLDDFYRYSQPKDQHGSWCKSCTNEYRQALRETHRDRERLVAHERYLRLRDKIIRYNCERNQQRKALLIAHYSNNTNKCACCGESDIRFLTIDHVNGNGNKHRKSTGCGTGNLFYQWLIKAGMPEGYQVLCYNCNIGRAWYGICPHQIGANNG